MLFKTYVDMQSVRNSVGYKFSPFTFLNALKLTVNNFALIILKVSVTDWPLFLVRQL